ncbi:hypothetical protein EVAR_56283_1 [Eumeta japonica]|uniref:Uncharacterized protein n=1 Tax=Eumeta variegata TaxID=151549 RepID=A0A4C1YJJ4_EUMVA|nr:hypothetical protein EVAR_56283_1 [Eumeta japonica]
MELSNAGVSIENTADDWIIPNFRATWEKNAHEMYSDTGPSIDMVTIVFRMLHLLAKPTGQVGWIVVGYRRFETLDVGCGPETRFDVGVPQPKDDNTTWIRSDVCLIK